MEDAVSTNNLRLLNVGEGKIIEGFGDQRTKGRKPYRLRHRFFGGKKKKDIENMEKKDAESKKHSEVGSMVEKDSTKKDEVDEIKDVKDINKDVEIKGILFLKDNSDITKELRNQLKKRGYHIETINDNDRSDNSYSNNSNNKDVKSVITERNEDMEFNNDSYERYDYNIRK